MIFKKIKSIAPMWLATGHMPSCATTEHEHRGAKPRAARRQPIVTTGAGSSPMVAVRTLVLAIGLVAISANFLPTDTVHGFVRTVHAFDVTRMFPKNVKMYIEGRGGQVYHQDGTGGDSGGGGVLVDIPKDDFAKGEGENGNVKEGLFEGIVGWEEGVAGGGDVVLGLEEKEDDNLTKGDVSPIFTIPFRLRKCI